MIVLYRDYRWSATRIGGLLGVSHKLVLRRLRAAGIEIRRRPRLPRPNCERCGGECPRPDSRFCSRACQRIYPQPQPRPCEECGTIFTPTGYKVACGAGRFHSYECWNRYRTGRGLTGTRAKPRTPRACAACGVTFMPKSREQRFHRSACATRIRMLRPRPCEGCGTLFKPDRSVRRFHSLKCWNRWRTLTSSPVNESPSVSSASSSTRSGRPMASGSGSASIDI